MLSCFFLKSLARVQSSLDKLLLLAILLYKYKTFQALFKHKK